MVKFFNQDEMGIEGIAGTVQKAGSQVGKSVSDQVSPTNDDIVNHLYGVPQNDKQQGDEEKGTEAVGQQKQNTRDMKAKTSARNPAAQQAALKRRQGLLKKGYKEEDIEKLDKLRNLLHQQQVADILNPSQKQQDEETPYAKRMREEREKKEKKVEKQQEEVKKKEELSVVQKRTGIENKGFGAG